MVWVVLSLTSKLSTTTEQKQPCQHSSMVQKNTISHQWCEALLYISYYHCALYYWCSINPCLVTVTIADLFLNSLAGQEHDESIDVIQWKSPVYNAGNCNPWKLVTSLTVLWNLHHPDSSVLLYVTWRIHSIHPDCSIAWRICSIGGGVLSKYRKFMQPVSLDCRLPCRGEKIYCDTSHSVCHKAIQNLCYLFYYLCHIWCSS